MYLKLTASIGQVPALQAYSDLCRPPIRNLGPGISNGSGRESPQPRTLQDQTQSKRAIRHALTNRRCKYTAWKNCGDGQPDNPARGNRGEREPWMLSWSLRDQRVSITFSATIAGQAY